MSAPTPERIHALFVEAFNGRDVEALMDLYEERDAILAATAGQPVAGKAAVREADGKNLRLSGHVHQHEVRHERHVPGLFTGRSSPRISEATSEMF